MNQLGKRRNPFENPIKPQEEEQEKVDVKEEIVEEEQEQPQNEPEEVVVEPVKPVIKTVKPASNRKFQVVDEESRDKYTATMETQLRRRIKIVCATRGIMFSEFIEEACKEKLRREGER